ncbi:MAG: TetR/AcrR family transcriptional regulator [Bacillota bacterium]
MKQPSIYSYEQIINAAFELIKEIGWQGVTTRAIAKKLGSSTMPIYSHLKSVEELEKELRVKASSLLKEFQQHPYTEHTLLNLAFGYVVFARDEKHLFRFLYLDRPGRLDLENMSRMKDAFFSEFGTESDAGKALLELKKSGQEALIQYTWIFTHGLAMLVNSGALGSNSDQVILEYLKNAGEAFYLWSTGRDNHIDDQDG